MGKLRLREAQHHWAQAHIIAKHIICRRQHRSFVSACGGMMLTFGQMMLCPADTNKKIHRDCDGFFGGTGQICLHLRMGMYADKGSARSSTRRQRSSALHLIIQICPSCFSKRKRTSFRMSFFFWRYWPDLNWRITVLQTGALPLGYGTNI